MRAIFSDSIVCRSSESKTAVANFSSSSMFSMIFSSNSLKTRLSVLIAFDVLLKGRLGTCQSLTGFEFFCIQKFLQYLLDAADHL